MNDIEEITIILTRRCNLKCSFCNVVYDSSYNLELTPEIVLKNLPYIEQIIANTIKPNINIVLMGGELFSDDISDDVIQSYYQLLKKTEQLCNQHNKNLSISLMSNLITKKIDRLINLANSFQYCDVHGSFDFVGRFDNPKLIDLWWHNAQTIKANNIEFFASVVGHKYNVQAITNHHPIWEKLYNQFGVYVQYYEPNNIANDYNLSFDQYKEFLLFLYKHYPKEKFLQSVLNAFDDKAKLCCRSNWLDNTGYHKCCDHSKIIKIYKNTHNCFCCQYYDRCPLVCPRVYHKNSNCIFKALFDYHQKVKGNQ